MYRPAPSSAQRSSSWRRAAERGLRLALLSDYYRHGGEAPHHVLVVNYSGIELEKLPQALARLAEIIKE